MKINNLQNKKCKIKKKDEERSFFTKDRISNILEHRQGALKKTLTMFGPRTPEGKEQNE